MGLSALPLLELGFSHMDLKQDPQLVGGLFGGLQGFGCACVRRMAKNGRCYQRCRILPIPDKVGGCGNIFFGVRHPRGGKIDDSLAQYRPQPATRHGARNVVGQKITVTTRGDAVQQHLGH